MRKRIVSAMLVIAMLLTMLPMQVFAASAEEEKGKTPFRDIEPGAWYEEAVQYVYENGLFAGTSEQTFSPQNSMTRGMYVTVIGRQVGVDTAAYAGKTQFSDVGPNAWYAPYVAWAAEQGITAGTGDGKFSPESLVTRQQMAVFTVRLFRAMGWELPGPTVTTTPKDLDQVADYAKESVMKLWACGMFAGDTAGNFLPEQVTTRAQAAVFLMRVDRHLVDTGRKEPTVEPEAPKPSKPGGGSGSGSGGGGSTSTTYYEVEFAFVKEQDSTGITLPDAKTYPSGTMIAELPTPYQRNGIFLGWYYDEDGTRGVESGDTVTKNMILYADFADGITPLNEQATPSYATRRDVGTDFTFQVQADSQQSVKQDLTIIHVTGGNKEMDFNVSGSGNMFTISAQLEPGQTYKATLEETSSAVFYEDGPMPASVRTLNFLTKMDEVLNLRLADGLIYLPVGEVSNMTGTALDGLISLSVADGAGTAQVRTSTGTFTYAGTEEIAVGDTVAIYEGVRPDQRDLTTDATDDAVAYVTITGISGTTYTYSAADTTDVLFTPEVLPVPADADIDGVLDDNSITVPFSTFAYMDGVFIEAGLDETTTPDVGDFLAFYTGTAGARDAAAPTYGRITGIDATIGQEAEDSPQSVEQYVITYEPVTEETVLNAMDIYSTRTEDIELTAEQRAQVEDDIERQALESGFVDEAANYLMALAEDTDGFQTLSESARVRLTATDSNGNPVALDTLAWEGKDWEFGEDDKKIEAHITQELDHFEDGKGLRAELKLTFSAEKDLGNDNKIGIELEAVFEQEILLSINVSGGAIWKWAWIIPYIYDFELNANIDVGTYTGIAVTAVASTSNDSEEEGVDWEELGVDVDKGEKLVDIGEKLVDLMNEEDSFLGQIIGGEDEEESGDEEEEEENPLVAKYAEMMESADESWIELVRKQLFHIEGGVDPFHILVFGFGADFVVSANLYITLGMTFEYGTAKRYNFHLLIFHNQATTETIDLEEAHYEFVFYVMGTIGVRAGVELEVAVGLLSLKLDSIGVTAEVGAYAQLWGYFYYWVAWSQSGGKEGFHSGALYVEVGIYLEVKFKAQLFSSDKLTYNPTLYENKWPLWSAGQAEDVYTFAYAQEDAPEYVWYTDKTLTLPDDAFTMTCLDLTSGESVDKTFDDTQFYITFTNPAFSYDTDTNTLTVTPGEDSVQETGEMNLVWGGAPLAFTSQPICRTIPLEWMDPEEGSFIKFDSNGGSIINMIFKKEGQSIEPPVKEPKKTGYIFAGWYEDNGSFQKSYTFPAIMPYYDTTVYAKWEPATDTKYTVRHYQQNLQDSGYTLVESETMTGTTDAQTSAVAKSYAGFTALPISQQSIAPDGSTVVEVRYDRNRYTATFEFGDRHEVGNEDTEPVIYTRKYGSTIYAPRLAAAGYIFRDYGEGIDPTRGFTLTENVTFTAQWDPDPNTPYRVEHYLQRVGGSGYLLAVEDGVTYYKGETDSNIPLETLKGDYTPPEGFTYEKATVNGGPAEDAVIGADGRTVVKLYYDRDGYTVTWDAKNDTEPQTSTHLSGAVIYAPALPVRAGYTFGGWFHDADVWAQPFQPGVDTIGSSGITLTAKWLPGTGTAYTVERYTEDLDGQSYTLAQKDEGLTANTDAEVTADTTVAIEGFTYDEGNQNNVLTGIVAGDGTLTLKVYYKRNSYGVIWKGWGDTEFATTKVKYGAVVEPPVEAPTRTGYAFAGWEGLTGETVMGTEPLTFTAKWTAKGDTSYLVEHYTEDLTGGGYTLAETQDLTGATASTVQAAPMELPGFTCDNSIDGTVASGEIAADGSLVLKLYYKRNSYTLTWMGHGTAHKTEMLKFGQTITQPTDAPTRIGYTFRDWGTVADTMPAEDTTCTAAWTANSYTVIFDAGLGTVSPTTMTVTYDGLYGELPVPNRTEYVFIGWYTQADGGEQVTADTRVMITGPQTLYAHWEKGQEVQYTVNHYQQNTEDNEYTLDAAEQKSGVVNGTTNAVAKDYGAGFTAKAVTQKTITASGTVVDIYYDRNSFALTWDANGGTAVGGTPAGQVRFGAAITAPTLSRTGYAGSWGAVAQTMPAADTTYTAQWTANTYTVTFNTNGGVVTPASAPVTFDQAYGNLPTPTRSGYKFAGWYTAETDGSAVTAETKVSTAGDHTLYAHWTESAYTITYQLNGGTNAPGNPTSYTYGTVVTLADPTRDGYEFGGWYEASDFSGEPVTEISANSTGDKTFYAKWIGKSVTVTLDTNGGTNLPVQAVTFGDAYGALPTPTWEGRVFEGWFTDPDSGTEVREDTVVTSAEAHTLYAHWRPAAYTITLTLNGGTLAADSGFTNDGNGYWTGNYTFSAVTPFTLPVPTNGPGRFMGWFEKPDLSGEAVTELSAESTGDRAYYAGWNTECKINYHEMMGFPNHADNPTTYTPGDSFTGHTLLDPPKQTGWTFLGWYWDSDFTQEATTIPQTQTGDVDLYAWWVEGTAHLITTQEELAGIEDHDGDIHFLMNDLTLTNWTDNFWLDGVFDGRGHTITYGGGCTKSLFATLNKDAEVRNLKVAGTLTPSLSSSYPLAGGIAETVYGTITDCSAEITISTTSSASLSYCGGLAGLLYNAGSIQFTSALPEGWAEISVTIDAPNCDYVGGLAGGSKGEPGGTITNGSGGTVTVHANLSGSSRAGGIIGDSWLTELSNFAVDVVRITTGGAGGHSGGLVGYDAAAMSISNCGVTNATTASIVAQYVNAEKPERNGTAGAFYGAAGNTVTDGGGNTLNGADADVNGNNALSATNVFLAPPSMEEPGAEIMEAPLKEEENTAPTPIPEQEHSNS